MHATQREREREREREKEREGKRNRKGEGGEGEWDLRHVDKHKTAYLSLFLSLSARTFLFKALRGTFLLLQSKPAGTVPGLRVFRTGVFL